MEKTDFIELWIEDDGFDRSYKLGKNISLTRFNKTTLKFIMWPTQKDDKVFFNILNDYLFIQKKNKNSITTRNNLPITQSTKETKLN